MISNEYKQGVVWTDIKIDNNVYMISVTWKDDIVEVFLTNLIEIWIETLTNDIIVERCRKLNPLLNVDALNPKEILVNIMGNISKHIVEASVEQIKLRAQIKGGSMKFALNLSKGTPQNFWEIVTKPLCISSMEIIRQHKILLHLIKRKDEEIAEYKAEGAELIRKNIETEIFKDEQLKTSISVPNVIECTNAFQAMMNFYNELNLDDSSKVSTQSASSTSKNDKIEQTEHSINTPSKIDSASGSKQVTNEDISMQRNQETVKSRSKSQNKSTTNEEITNSKSRVIRMVHKPIKKLKKGVNDFI